MSLINDVLKVSSAITRRLHGEPVTLRDSAGVVTLEIDDAVITIDPASIGGIGDGPGEYRAVVRLSETHRENALLARTIEMRSESWHIISVADVFAATFRIEARRQDKEHSNRFDIGDRQTVWRPA